MRVVVIGGGASGMVAAIAAARKGAEVTLIEKEERVGKKLLATGNGKCNYSNTIYSGGEYNEDAEDFVKEVFKQVSPEKTLEFFDELGIYPRFESEGRVYPASEQAASVVDALRLEVEKYRNIEVVYSHWVKGLIRRKTDLALVTHRNLRLIADSVIIACGGYAGTKYGCQGDGFALAEALEHTVKEPCPALVQLTSDEKFFAGLKGVRAKGSVTLMVEENGEEIEVASDKGEIQFTEFGISGICVFNISGRATRLIREGKSCSAVLNLFPELSSDELKAMIMKRFENSSHKLMEDFLNGLINKKMIPVVMKACGVKKMTDPVTSLTEEQLEQVAEMLGGWRVQLSGSKSWNDAQTTSGGVLVSEINPETMESKHIPGLYFAGEVADVDGRCGGYNLQWAWSSGILAGSCAAEPKA